MTQLDLFDGGDLVQPVVARARASDPETSHLAATEVENNGAASAHRSVIAAYLRSNPGKTNAEIAEGSGLDYAQVHKRMVELEREGRIIRGAQRKCAVHQRLMIAWYPK